MSRYRVIALHGTTIARSGEIRHPDTRAHGIQEVGTGGRIIGDGWGLDRRQAERIAEELERAFEAGTEAVVEA